jgi:hypothetical protein
MNVCNGQTLLALRKWEKEVGISRQTSARFRARGWLKTVTIAGKPYLTGASIDSFLSRAKAGELAHVNKSIK